MLKVLINAYAICPNYGSEQGMGWNYVTNIAKHCDCYVITEGEYKEINLDATTWKCSDIGTNVYGLTQVQCDNIHFYFVDVSPEIRKMCWNQGTWSFYRYYADWQKRILPIARQIIEENDIDVMHQLNMVGFREPGMLYKINEEREAKNLRKIPLIWGPMAGYGSIPFSFMLSGGIKFTSFYLLKNVLNRIQMMFHPRVRKMIKVCDKLIAATPDMKKGIKVYYGKDVEIINETGTYLDYGNEDEQQYVLDVAEDNDKSFKLLWVGRFLYTKQLPIALKTFALLSDLKDIELHIVGKGVGEADTIAMHSLAEELGVNDRIVWHGQIPNEDVQVLMKKCDIFFFTSIFEATSTVVLEAIQNELPIVCFDRCGFGPIVDENIGRKIKCKNPSQAISDFAKVIRDIYMHKEVLIDMSLNCKERQYVLSWNNKMDRLMNIYEEAIKKNMHN